MDAKSSPIARVSSVAALVAVVGLLAAAVTPSSAVRAQVGVDPVPPTVAVPAAECGLGSRPETGLQGQVPEADRASGRSLEGYQCNLEALGQYQHGEGASWQFDWYENCAYYGTLSETDLVSDKGERTTATGAVVVDVSDPAKPVETALLDTPAMNDPHESLKVNEAKGLLAAVDLGETGFDLYDISDDCTQPKLLASKDMPSTGHEGEWSPDGRTYWGSDAGRYFAVDVDEPTEPVQIAFFEPDGGAHGLTISDDGNRGYFVTTAPAGLIIADLSEVQARKPGAQIREISRVSWADGVIGQHTILTEMQGTPYVIQVDEGGRGAGRIIDISDETRPIVVSKLKLEVHLPQNEALTQPEWERNGRATPGLGSAIFTYDGHYCSTDRFKEPTTLACGYFESGIRVFDIRDPLAPKEIAYYNPPALGEGVNLAGSSHFGDGTADRCAAQVRLLPSAGQLWTQCQENEMLTLNFTNGAYPVALPGRDLGAACPEDGVPPAGYSDVEEGSTHARAIDCVTAYRVATGKPGNRYDPGGGVTRGQMASFVVRMMEAAGTVLDTGPDRFSDDNGTDHESSINKLANAGIVVGTGGTGFSPDAPVNRAQAATILNGGYERAAGLPLVTDDDFFTDDAGPHESAINRLTGAAIVSGTAVSTFSPGASIPRDQAASLLARTLVQLTQDGKTTPPTAG